MAKAQEFLNGTYGSGGTEMMKAIKAALDPTDKQDHVRIVCFMTDGYVGNDMEIIDEVQKHPNARVFSFGIGSSVNRFLLDKIAEEGRGEVEYVSLTDDGSAAARRFHERVRNPLLTDISIDWNGLPVTDIYPKRIPDLFGAKPVIVSGRYRGPANGTIRLKGKNGGSDFSRDIAVKLAENEGRHDVLSSLWARRRIDDLMSKDYNGVQQGSMKDELKQTIVNLGLEFRLMTQFTSFVAVEEMIVTDGGQPRRVDVPVEVPEGVRRDAVFGDRRERKSLMMFSPGMVTETVMVTKSGTNSAGAKPKRERAGGGAGGSGFVRGVAQMETDEASSTMESRVHPMVAALIERLKKPGSKPTADEAKFVHNGKAEIQIWFTDKSEAVMAKLKELGFEIVLEPKTAKMVMGRIPLAALPKLIELKEIRFISPQQ
jgi:Ca-activated chloride channel family protein